MVLRNYVTLEMGVPARMHFTEHVIQARDITDPVTGRPKTVKALVFTVSELNGQPVTGYYSTVSDKHARDFEPFLEGQKYLQYDFVVVKSGSGFRTEFSVQPLPRL